MQPYDARAILEPRKGFKMADNEKIVVFAGTYGSLHEAELDFQTIKDLHKEKSVGKYEAAMFTKQDDGSVKIIDTDVTSRSKGLKIGAVAGAVVGILFPPSLIVGAIAGGGIGLMAGHFSKGLKRGDIKELGELLDDGQAGIVFVGVVTPGQSIDHLLRHALKTMTKQVDANAEDVKKAIGEVGTQS
jgi:uncharacterized membrane protein